jgi:hypothetical protein
MIQFLYRVTKYDTVFRDEHDFYRRNEWLGYYDVGEEIEGHVLTEDEYLEVENRYLYAVETFLREAGVEELVAHDVNDVKGLRPELFEGALYSVDEAIGLAREILREEPFYARLEAEGRFYLHVGERMYMWIGTDRECPHAVAEARRIGLFVEEGVPSPEWNEPASERHYWLRDGAPVRYRLLSTDRTTGEILGSVEIPEERVDALRRLFRPKRYDPHFRDRYVVGDGERAEAAAVLEADLNPDVDYVISTYSPE